MRNRRGSLLIGLLVVSTLWALGAPFVTISLNESRLQGIAKDRTQTLAVAEAGVEQAIWEYNHNSAAFPLWANLTVVNNDPSSDSWCPSGACKQRILPVSADELDTATVTVSGWNTRSPLVRAKGTIQKSLVKTILTVHLHKTAPFLLPLHVDKDMTFNDGTSTSSFDSATGVYCTPPNCMGDIESNSGFLWLNGFSGFLNGVAWIDTPDPYWPAIDRITGTPPTQPQGADLVYPALVAPGCPAGSTSLPPISLSGNRTISSLTDGPGPYCTPSVNLNGSTLTFAEATGLYVSGAFNSGPSGSFHWQSGTVSTGNVTLSGSGANVQVTGKTEWYVTGSATISGSANINSNAGGRISSNFRLYVDGTTTDTVTLSGGGTEFYGVIYAPNLEVISDQSADIRGGVIAKKFTISGTNADLIYDMQLPNVTDWPAPLNTGTKVIVSSWTRQNGN